MQHHYQKHMALCHDMMLGILQRAVTIVLELNARRPLGHASSQFCTSTGLGHTSGALGLPLFPKIDNPMGQGGSHNRITPYPTIVHF